MNRITKIYLLLYFICIALLPSISYAQTDGKYRLRLSFERIRNHGNTMKHIIMEFYTSSQGREQQLSSWRHGKIEGDEVGDAPPSITRDYITSDGNVPDRIRIWSEKRTNPWFGSGTPYYAQDSKSWDRSLPYVRMDFNRGDAGDSFIDKMSLLVHLELIPVSINLHYYTDRGEGGESSLRLLPDRDVITLKATKGFVASTYQWQYQVAGESQWHDMPTTVSYSQGKSVVTFKGTDLFTLGEFIDLIRQRKNILFRINAITDERRNQANYTKIALTPTYAAPHIISHEATQEKCHQSRDASVRVYLDRPLQANEALAVFQEGGRSFNIDHLDTANSFSIDNLAAGSYTFRIRGTHSNGLETYRDTEQHRLSVTIAERPMITHTFTQKNVSCFAGHDGAITLTASGGTGRFTAELRDGTGALVQTQTFDAGTTTFNRLSAGSYTIRLQDSNSCVAKTPSGEELIHSLRLTEPTEAVSIRELRRVSPLAYQSSDGSIQIAVTGGAPSPSGYIVRFVRAADGQVFTPDVRPEEDHYIYTLSNIPRGEYTVIAKDMRFESLSNEDQQPPCGCSAQTTITLEAPPPLVVHIEETHFVHCHGEANGELTAHAEGGKPITSAQLPYTYAWYKISETNTELLPLYTDSIARNLGAGQYQIKVTDANGIVAQSPVFSLTQPQPLSLSFTTRSPSCRGGSGLITSIVTGGTAPYSYEWNKEGEIESTLRVNEAGSFFLRVVDSRGCAINGRVEVTTPDDISIKPTLKHPTCHNATDGSISLALSGGTAPYTVRWEDDNRVTTANRNGLRAGEYVAIVTDQAGCSLHYRLVLVEPEALRVKLNDGFTLCRDQARKLTARPSIAEVTYKWFRDGQLLPQTGNELLVNRAGRYRILITNANGCTASDEVEIKASDTELPIDITAPTSVMAGAPIHMVNISRIRADRLEWLLPPEAIVTSKNNEEINFTISTPGVYQITVIGHLGDCSTLITQRLEVVGAGGIVLPDGKDSPIKQFLVTPNPTTGDFRVYVELKDPQDFTLRLLSPSSVEMDKKIIKHTQKQTFDYELRGNVEGVFGVELIVSGVKSVLRITKRRK